MFDVLTLAAVADELADTLVDGRIQRIGVVDRLSLAAEIYAGGRRRWLVASAHTQAGRLHLTERPPSLDTALVTPFGLLLRKYARGGVVVGVEQPPLERLVRLSIAKRMGPHNGARPRRDDALVDDEEAADAEAWVDEDGEFAATYVHLVIELMGRHSNLLLVNDEGAIMESAKHVTTSMSRVRPIRPRLPYTLPPPVEKPDPRRLTTDATRALLRSEPAEAPLAQVLVRRLRAVSPQMAREIAYRSGGDVAATVGSVAVGEGPSNVARETRGLLEPLLTSAWSPRVYRSAEGETVFAPIPLAHLAGSSEEISVPTISAAVDMVLAEPDDGAPVSHSQRRERLAQAVREGRERVQARLASIEAQEARAAQVERLRRWGELIYAYLWQIEPGQRELAVDGVTIPLDPALSGKENAQAYFEQYRKAQGAAGHLPELRAETERERAYLDQLLTMVNQAEGFAAIEALTAEWEIHRGPDRRNEQRPSHPRRRATPARPRPVLERSGNSIYIGRSGRENDLVTFDIAGPDDTWLHARGVPGSHVIVRWRQPGADEDPETIGAAAALAAYYSAARGSASVEVDVTRRRHVRKIKGAGPGMVTYRQERTLAVRPAPETALGTAQDGERQRLPS